MIKASFLNRVGGAIPQDVCEILAQQACTVPKDGVILDLECGEGRSTLSMALALDSTERDGIKIIAVDTHITNPRSTSPYEDGTIMRFLRHLQSYGVMHRVVPVLMPSCSVIQVLSKRCANMVVVQAPENHADLSAIGQGIETAKDAVRRGGRLVVCRPNIPARNFTQFVAGCLPGSEFTLIFENPGIVVYEHSKKGG